MYCKEPVADTPHPVDIIEPLEETNEYRECALRFLTIISLALTYITEQDDSRVAALGVAFALGLVSVVGNKTMRELGKELNISSGTISFHSKRFSRAAGLPPSALMRDEADVKQARENRNNFCQ